ncbi:MAG: reverse transcriptase-like protein [Rhizomicrobium sp.]
MNIKVYIDGSTMNGISRSGQSGAGAVIKTCQGNVIAELRRYIGIRQPYEAEYMALIIALEYLTGLKDKFENISFYADSDMVIDQITEKYPLKNPDLFGYYKESKRLLKKLKKYSNLTFSCIPSQDNKYAHRLAREAVGLCELI